MEMKAKARRLKLERNLDIVFVDYIQLMRAGGRFENRNQEMSHISRSLKELAKELHIPVVGISQLSRAPEKARGAIGPAAAALRPARIRRHRAGRRRGHLHLTGRRCTSPRRRRRRQAEAAASPRSSSPSSATARPGLVQLAFQDKFAKFENPTCAYRDAGD